MKTTAKIHTEIRCRHNTAGLILILIGTLFVFTSCTAFYRAIGLTDEQAKAQTEKDQESRQNLTDQFRLTTTELISSAMAGAGAILSGLLARWLGTERKMTTALITGIEKADTPNVKKYVKAKAITAGIESKLNARVQALT